jgi:hypothetical protein
VLPSLPFWTTEEQRDVTVMTEADAGSTGLSCSYDWKGVGSDRDNEAARAVCKTHLVAAARVAAIPVDWGG